MEAAPLFATTSTQQTALEDARARAAKMLGTSPKRLLTDAALQAIIAARPTTELALRGVKGVGLRAASVLAPDVVRLFGGSTVTIPELDLDEPVTVPEPVVEDTSLSVAAYLTSLNNVLGSYGAVVRGEVTEAREYPSGIYFSIKDASGAEGVLNCYLPPYRVRLFAHLITHGAELRVAGAPKIAMRKGGFSFQVEAIEAVGEGALRAAYEALKRQLDEEGLFDRALPLPLATKRIGVVTSRAGAVIDDFKKNLEKRGYALLMHDARVEGVRAVPSILAALSWFSDHADRVDVVVVMRGGGSLEDLQAFNHEAVARAIAALPMPVIAAIGHDRDVPIANLAADHSTSTPSIAALRINQSWERADQVLALAGERLVRGAQQVVGRVHHRLDVATERMAGRSMVLIHRVEEQISRASTFLAGQLYAFTCIPDTQLTRIKALYEASLQRLGDRLLAVERELAIVDPQRTLSLGYSILTDASGKTVRSVYEVPVGSAVTARLADGTVSATVTDAHPED